MDERQYSTLRLISALQGLKKDGYDLINADELFYVVSSGLYRCPYCKVYRPSIETYHEHMMAKHCKVQKV